MKHINSVTLHIAPTPNNTCPDMTAYDRPVYSRCTKFSPTHPVATVLRSLPLPSIPVHSVCLPSYISSHVKCFLNFSVLPSQHTIPVLSYQPSCTFIQRTVKRQTRFTSVFFSFKYYSIPTFGYQKSGTFPISNTCQKTHFPNSQYQTEHKAFLRHAHD